MANTPDVRISEGRVLGALRTVTPDVRMSEGRTLGAIGFPTPHLRASEARALAAARVNGPMNVSEARVLAAVKGRIANPRVRAWTFTLDGEDFYILRLGDTKTLVYGNASKEWVEWKNDTAPMWAVNIGTTWIGGQSLAHQYGSNIVVGDDSWGLLWFLNPLQPYDNHPDPSNKIKQLPYTRMVTGQVVVRGREAVPCNTIFMTGDNYGITVTDFTPAVTLQISDDQGKTFFDHDTITLTPDTTELPYEWYSMGSITQPGRLFRIVDNGVFARIDSMNMNDDGG
jgi:hypothetical protein